jgi:hypothetical protein
MAKATRVHSTPRRTASKIHANSSPVSSVPATTEHESIRARADYYSDLEQPMRELAVMTTVLVTICQSPPIMPPGIKHEDLVHFLIGHLDLMVQDIFGNHRERLQETAVLS